VRRLARFDSTFLIWTKVVGVSVWAVVLVVTREIAHLLVLSVPLFGTVDDMGEQREEAPKLEHWEGASRADLL